MAGIDLSVVEMNVAQAMRIVGSLSNDIPVMMWGEPGLGKTGAINSTFQNMGHRVIPVLAGCSEPTDLTGIPFDFEGKYAKYLAPWWAYLCSTHDEVPAAFKGDAVLFFDDIVTAPEQTQAAFYKTVHEKMVGSVMLRDNVRIIAAGNRVDDKSAATEMPKALANRFLHVYVKSDPEIWCNWARQNGLHPDVVSFIRHAPQRLSTFRDALQSEEQAFATPRSWEMCSKAMFCLDKAGLRYTGGTRKSKNVKKAQDLSFRTAAGIIGNGLSLEFCTFVRNTATLIAPEEIVKDPKGCPVPNNTEIDVLHATVAGCEHYIGIKENHRHWRAMMTYALRILPELGLILAKQITDIIMNQLPNKEKAEAGNSEEFIEMFNKWGDHLTSAE